ncbi:M-phase inducer phosphatase 1-like [Arapaima gigas]
MNFSPVSDNLTRRRPHGVRAVSPQPYPHPLLPATAGEAVSSGSVLSPITSLALNMNNLAVLARQCDTPKRRAVPLLKISSFQSDSSSDIGLGMDSPSRLDSVDIEETKMPLRRIHSLPVQVLDSSPLLKDKDLKEQSFGAFCKQDDQPDMGHGNKENMFEEVFEFKKPNQPASRYHLQSCHNVENFIRRPSSAPTLVSSPTMMQQCMLDDKSPFSLRRSSLLSSLDDEGFLDLEDHIESDCDMPMGMANLLTAPLVRETTMEDVDSVCLHPVDSVLNVCSADRKIIPAFSSQPVIHSRRRDLFSSPLLPSPSCHSRQKRHNGPQDENTSVRVKRPRSVPGLQAESGLQKKENTETGDKLDQSLKICHPDIEKLLENDTKDLIGDFSKPFLLATVEGKHQDLKYITSEMMSSVLNGKFDHLVEKILVIDCRYPYEFEGGHIKGALNLHHEEDVEQYLLKKPITPSSPDKRVLLIFHCEFSSERGPRMCRFVRERDRMLNQYPTLFYPELYVLKGGYKEFFPRFQKECEPQAYRPMHHEDFKEDLRRFRLKSRTWAGERSKRGFYNRIKNL